MKNKIILTSFIYLSLAPIQTEAQDISATVGNPSSLNTMIVTNVTGIESTPQNLLPNYFEPLPDSPGVEVAPPPNRLPHDNSYVTPPDFIQTQPTEISETISVE